MFNFYDFSKLKMIPEVELVIKVNRMQGINKIIIYMIYVILSVYNLFVII